MLFFMPFRRNSRFVIFWRNTRFLSDPLTKFVFVSAIFWQNSRFFRILSQNWHIFEWTIDKIVFCDEILSKFTKFFSPYLKTDDRFYKTFENCMSWFMIKSEQHHIYELNIANSTQKRKVPHNKLLLKFNLQNLSLAQHTIHLRMFFLFFFKPRFFFLGKFREIN